jgi:galactokinase
MSECARVDAVAGALAGGDLVGAGAEMDASHHSLSQEFEVSTPELDELVASLRSRPGVVGARVTGAGFGGCVVVLAERGAIDLSTIGRPSWQVEAVDGAVTARSRHP